jgi:uncharacterized protein YebE (UPF0316 family)
METINALFGTPLGAVFVFLFNAVNVTLMTVRQIMAVRGHRTQAAAIGFFQKLFWLLAVAGTLQHVNSIGHVVGYAGGFAAGAFLGISVEEHLAVGTSVVHAAVASNTDQQREAGRRVAEALHDQDFAVTKSRARGWRGDMDLMDVVVPRRKVEQVVNTVRKGDPDAHISVEDVEATSDNFPAGPADQPTQERFFRRAA